MYIFNVYLPYDKLDNEEEYIDRLAKLHNILAECDSTYVAVVRDYNANVLKKKLTLQFCWRNTVVSLNIGGLVALSYRKELIRMLVMPGVVIHGWTI